MSRPPAAESRHGTSNADHGEASACGTFGWRRSSGGPGTGDFTGTGSPAGTEADAGGEEAGAPETGAGSGDADAPETGEGGAEAGAAGVNGLGGGTTGGTAGAALDSPAR